MHSEEVWNNLYSHAAKLFSKWRVNPQDLHDLAMDAVVKTLEQEIKPGVRLETVLQRAATKVYRVYCKNKRLDRIVANARRAVINTDAVMNSLYGFPAYKDRKIFAEKVFARA